jgi:carbonic anhydrase
MPEQALQRLLEGNRRYVAAQPALNESATRRLEIAHAQKPFATVLSCIDSRVPPELIFDQGLGELLVVRSAGQALDRAVLGSLEFGVAELHIPLIVVLGHERCGTVKLALDVIERYGVADGEMEYLVEALRPAVKKVKSMGGDVWGNVVRAQIEMSVERLQHTLLLGTALRRKQLKIVGALYDLETGLVEVTVP